MERCYEHVEQIILQCTNKTKTTIKMQEKKNSSVYEMPCVLMIIHMQGVFNVYNFHNTNGQSKQKQTAIFKSIGIAENMMRFYATRRYVRSTLTQFRWLEMRTTKIHQSGKEIKKNVAKKKPMECNKQTCIPVPQRTMHQSRSKQNAIA